MVPVLIHTVDFYGWSREEKESVEVDSERDKPGKPNWGLTCQLPACCHHCHELGREGECSDQPVPKVTTKNVSAKCVVRSRLMDRGKYVVDEEREWLIEFSQAKSRACSASLEINTN